jgi:hypothetical protein
MEKYKEQKNIISTIIFNNYTYSIFHNDIDILKNIYKSCNNNIMQSWMTEKFVNDDCIIKYEERMITYIKNFSPKIISFESNNKSNNKSKNKLNNNSSNLNSSNSNKDKNRKKITKSTPLTKIIELIVRKEFYQYRLKENNKKLIEVNDKININLY